VIKNIERYGGDSTSGFVSGHSAGGYLPSMVWINSGYHITMLMPIE